MFELPNLPYPYNSLEPYIDELTMQIHHDKHHAAYVNNLNEALSEYKHLKEKNIDELLKNIEKLPSEIREKIRNNGGGHANHSLFWQIMSPNSNKQPHGKLLDAINSIFGSFQTFQEKFSQAGLGRFGSGWVWLTIDDGKLAIIDTPNQDSPLSYGKEPILALDVWEHAYYLKYQNRRADYIKAWWNVVNWSEVQKRFEQKS